jgi:hypothetical protein
MALKLADRVYETSTSFGLGSFDLNGAVAGFQSFIDGIGDATQTYYAIVSQNGEWEVGLGTVTVGVSGNPNRLSRDTVIDSSSGVAVKVNFANVAAPKDVFCEVPASALVFQTGGSNWTIAGTLDVVGAVTFESAAFSVAGLSYSWPVTQAANRFLHTDGAGNLTWTAINQTLAALTDVSLATPAAGQFLAYTGSAWANTTTLGVANGGTGLNAATLGDVPYGSGTNTLAQLAGNTTTTKKFLSQTGTGAVSAAPAWATLAAADIPNLSTTVLTSGVLGVTRGGTGVSAIALGDLLYGSAATTLSALAGNTTTTKQILTQTGTGSASAAPVWGTLSAPDIGVGTFTGAFTFASGLRVNGSFGIGAAASGSAMALLSSNVAAATARAAGLQVTGTLTASANNDVLSASYLAPAFSHGSFTGVAHVGLDIANVTGGASNYAIRTGTGVASFGDVILGLNGIQISGAQLLVSRTTTGSPAINVQTAGDTNARVTVMADGSLAWGSGAATSDTTLGRIGVGNLRLTGGSDGNSTFAVGQGGAAPTTGRTAKLVLNSPSSATFAGQSIVVHQLDSVTKWQLGLTADAAAGARAAATDYAWHNGTAYVAALATTGQLTLAGGLMASVDGGANIGSASANRFQHLYLTGNAVLGGTVTATDHIASASSAFSFTGRSKVVSSADGSLTLLNNAGTGFTQLLFGGTTSAFPALKRSAAGVVVRLADDSANAALTAGDVVFSGTTGLGGLVYTWPGTQAPNQVLQTDGAGGLTWVTTSTVTSLASLSDVTITSPAADNLLVYDSGTSKWKNLGTLNALTVSGVIASNSNTQAQARLKLVGQEFYQAATTATDGVAVLLGVNRTGNRQLWLADTASLTQNATNPTLQFRPNAGTIASVATDGTTALAMTLSASAITLGTNTQINGIVGIGAAPAAGSGLLVQPAAQSTTNQFGIYLNPTGSSSATGKVDGLYVGVKTEASAFTTAALHGVYIDQAVKGAGSTITTQYGLYIDAQTQGATNYALYTNQGIARIGDTLRVNGAVVAETDAANNIGTSATAGRFNNAFLSGRLVVAGSGEPHGASKAAFAFGTGTLSMWSWGANASTPGNFGWETRSSDGTVGGTSMLLSHSGTGANVTPKLTITSHAAQGSAKTDVTLYLERYLAQNAGDEVGLNFGQTGGGTTRIAGGVYRGGTAWGFRFYGYNAGLNTNPSLSIHGENNGQLSINAKLGYAVFRTAFTNLSTTAQNVLFDDGTTNANSSTAQVSLYVKTATGATFTFCYGVGLNPGISWFCGAPYGAGNCTVSLSGSTYTVSAINGDSHTYTIAFNGSITAVTIAANSATTGTTTVTMEVRNGVEWGSA